MGQTFIDGMEFLFANWTNPKRFGVYSQDCYIGNTMKDGIMGFEWPKIDKESIAKKVESVTV
jgi:hypothetical protein